MRSLNNFMSSAHNHFIVNGTTPIITGVITIFFVLLTCTGFAQGPQVDNNLGTWSDGFNDELGTSLKTGLTVNPFAGTIQLTSGQNSGSQTSVEIAPTSADGWLTLCLDATYSGNTDLTVDILNAADNAPIPGFQSMDMSMVDANGCFDISALSYATYSSIKVRINHTRGATAPSVSELKVTWNPVTLILFDKVAPVEIQAGQSYEYRVRVSANFVDAENLVVWDVLPTNANAMVQYQPGENYGQDDAPSLVTVPLAMGGSTFLISNGGQYTASAITVGGINIPAGSVYWQLPNLKAGNSISLRFSMNTVNGILDGTTFSNRAYFNVANGDDGQSDLEVTTVRSTPGPTLQKDERTLNSQYCPGSNIIAINNVNYVFENDVVTFCLLASNFVPAEGEGNERIYNTVLWDNLDDLAPIYAVNGMGQPIVTGISGGGQYTATAITVAGHNIPANSVYWNLGVLTSQITHSFSLQLANGVAPAGPFTNTAYLISDQTPQQQDGFDLNILPNADGLGGSAACGKDDPYRFIPADAIPYEQAFNSSLAYVNNGVGTLRNNVIFDRIPNERTFISAWFANPHPGTNGQIWYFEDNTGTYTDANTPPLFDWSNPGATPGVAWTQTPPTDDNAPNESIWVAFYVPSITSSVYQTDPNLPSGISMRIRTSLIDQGCNQTQSVNVGIFRSYGRTSPLGVLTDKNYNEVALFNCSSSDGVYGKPLLPRFLLASTGNNITPFVFDLPNSAVYNATITVDDQGTGEPINNVVATVQLQQINVNGVLQYPSINSITGPPVTSFNPTTGTLTFDIGSMYNGDDITVSITLGIPLGTLSGERYGASISALGEQNTCVVPVSIANIQTGQVQSNEAFQVFKNDVVSLISSGGHIDYIISYRGLGPSPSENTWIVDRIPFQTTFLKATAPLGERVWFTDKLPPDLPTNQISVLDPVDFSVIQANFVPGIVNDNGTPGNYADDIITSPFGDQTTWIAYQVDAPNQTFLPVTAAFKKVTFQVQNDLDGTGPNTVGSPSGTVIFNEVAMFSDNLLQAVGNEVRTTISAYPGLFLQKTSDQEIMPAGTTFNWIIDYYNTSDAIDNIVIATDALPAGVTLNSVSHEWNATALANGFPAGVVDITGNSSLVTIIHNPDGTTEVQLKLAGSPGLAPVLLTEEGGKIVLNVTIANTVPSATILINNVQGVAENGISTTVINDQDPVSVFNPDLSINKLVNDNMPNSGDVQTYTLVVSNEGLVPAPSVVLTDVLPAGATYVPGSTALLTAGYTLGEPTVSGSTLTWSNLTNTSLGTPGIVPALSGPIYITYRVNVSGMSGDMFSNSVVITTPVEEDQNFPNEDMVDSDIPFPDPSVQKFGNELVQPGGPITYDITYRNLNNYTADNVYILETLPDWDSDGNAEVTYVSHTLPAGVTAYFNAATGAAPVFDPLNPTSNGWSATPTTPVNHIVYHIGMLAANAPATVISLVVNALEPITGILPPAGTNFYNTVTIFTSSQDDDPTNNTDDHTTITPGVDVGITKVGSSEGSFPGLRPGDLINYTIRISNTGSQTAYGLRVQDQLPPNFIPASPLTDFITVFAFDDQGDPISLLDPTGDPIAGTIPATQSGSLMAGGAVTWALGSTANNASPDHYQNVGLPVGAYVEFVINGTISGDAANGDAVDNTVTALYEGPVGNITPEQFLNNNTASTSTTIYLPELTLNKRVFAGAELDANCDSVMVTYLPQTSFIKAFRGDATNINGNTNLGALNLDSMTPYTTLIATTFPLSANDQFNVIPTKLGTNDFFIVQMTAKFYAATAGNYTFGFNAAPQDRGAVLINGILVAERDDNSPLNFSSTIALEAGYHDFELRYMEINANYAFFAPFVSPGTLSNLIFAEGITTCDGAIMYNGEEQWTESGDTLTYVLEYNNIGDADADNVTIDEIIPAGTTYIPGSLTLPQGATVAFAPDALNPSSFTVNLGTLPAPANYDGGALHTDNRPLFLDSISMYQLQENDWITLRSVPGEPPAIGTPGNPVPAPIAPQPPVPAAPMPTIPPEGCPVVPAAPTPAVPAAPTPAIPAAPMPVVPAAPALVGGVTLGSCNCATQSAIPQIECEALVALYNSTAGAGWTASATPWGSNNNPASWTGVTVVGGRVTQLNLLNRNLTGPLPAELGNLTESTNYQLANNRLTGTLPPALGNLTKMKTLDLGRSINLGGNLPPELWQMGLSATAKDWRFDGCSFNGTLPASWGANDNWSFLQFRTNSITGPLPPEWGNIKTIGGIDISRNPIANSLPAEWWQLGINSINKRFDFSIAQLTGTLPASWGANTGGWDELKIESNSITGPLPPEWGNITRMRIFYANTNLFASALPAEWWSMGSANPNKDWRFNTAGLTGTLPASWGNNSFGLLMLTNNPNLTGPLPPEWGNITRMDQLFLDQNPGLNTPLPAAWGCMGNSSNTKNWQINNSSITGTLPASWGANAGWSTLSLNNLQITGPLPPEWGNIPRMQTFSFQNNATINSPLPPEWWGMGNLSTNKSWSISGNSITGPLPASWGAMENFSGLNLSSNQITGPLPPEWGNINNISSFALNNNPINAPLPPEWWTFANAAPAINFRINNAGITGTLPASWGNWKKIQNLYLFSNSITGTLPPEWGNMTIKGTCASFNQNFQLHSNQISGYIPEAWANIRGDIPGTDYLGRFTLYLNKVYIASPLANSPIPPNPYPTNNPVLRAWLDAQFAPGCQAHSYNPQNTIFEDDLENPALGYYTIPVTSGTFATPIFSNGNLSAWQKLYVEQTVPVGASITYTLYTGGMNSSGPTGTPIPGHTGFTMESGVRDISDIDPSLTNLVLYATLTRGDNNDAPILKSWRASYVSGQQPTITFQVAVADPLSTSITQIDNTASINTTTEEQNPNDNTAEDEIYVRLTDLAITKSVDKAAVLGANDETITYTLDWEVLGPQEAINAVVVDVLPANVAFVSESLGTATLATTRAPGLRRSSGTSRRLRCKWAPLAASP